MTTPNLTGATIEVILADRTRARIALSELLNHLASPTAPVDDVVRADAALSKTLAHPLSDEAEAASRANTLLVTNDFVEALAKANDGTNAAVAKVAKKVAAKTAGKKAGSGDAI